MKQDEVHPETEMRSHPESDETGPSPSNLVGRRWRTINDQHGWRRLVALATTGAEVLLIIVAIAVLIL